MIDIHSHILHGLDDGAKTLDESLEMCRIAVADGITTIAATPHSMNGKYVNDKETVLKKAAELSAALKDNNINLAVYAGMDLHIYPGIIKDLEEGRALTLNNSNYFLLELPFQSLPSAAPELVSRLVDKGFIPIITHPERNEGFLRDFAALENYRNRGALFQVTAMSITGEFGERIREFSFKMLKAGLVDTIASDAHSPTVRPPLLSRAVAIATKFGKLGNNPLSPEGGEG